MSSDVDCSVLVNSELDIGQLRLSKLLKLAPSIPYHET